MSVTPQKSHVTRDSNSLNPDHPLRWKHLIFLQNIGTLYLTTVVFQKAVIFLIQFGGSIIRQPLYHNHTAKLFLKRVHTTGVSDAR